MLTNLIKSFVVGAKQILFHPRILFVLVLVVALPLLLLFLMQQVFMVASNNADSMARTKTGTLHDALQSGLVANNFDSEAADELITRIMATDPGLINIIVAIENGEDISILASADPELVGTAVSSPESYLRSLATAGQPLIVEFETFDDRRWETTSAFKNGEQNVFILTTESFKAYDAMTKSRELFAYFILISVMAFLLSLGYWLIRDIDFRTKYYQSEKKLAEQNQISNLIAHELRSPLTAMRGYASLIMERTEPETDIRTHADRISESTDRLLNLVNDFLEVARLQSGQLSIKSEVCSPAAIIKDAVEELRPLATEKSLTLSINVETARDVLMTTDGSRLHQIITNLTSNAIKYTPQGSVTVELNDKHNRIEIRIKDTGTGISAEDQQKLFTPFFRIQSAYTQTVTGTGLGMWITSQLVEKLGGTIGVESIKDVGTNVVLSFKKDRPVR